MHRFTRRLRRALAAALGPSPAEVAAVYVSRLEVAAERLEAQADRLAVALAVVDHLAAGGAR